MSTVAALARTVAMTPVTILRSTQTKFSVLFAGLMGFIIGADARAMGRKPRVVFNEVRQGTITENGRLADTEAQPRTPMDQWAAEHIGEWATEPVITTPESWNRALEQAVIVPMIRGILSLTEVAAGIGYWFAGFLPAVVVDAMALVVVLVALVVYLASFREKME